MVKTGWTRAVTLMSGCAIAVVGVAVAGCGGGSDFKNEPRPPVPVQLTAVVTDRAVTVSPNRVGAGPIILVVSNQSRQAHEVTLEGPSGLADKTGPVNPLDTGQIQQTLRPGEYTVAADSAGAVKPATLFVGRERKNSSNTLLLP